MLTRLNENLKLVNNLGRPHKGLVVLTDAAETKKLGRVKVRIKSLLEETDTDKLPWVYPQSPAGLGGKPNTGSFMVPEIGSEVTVVFPFDDVYAPFYIGHWKSDLTIQNELFTDNYPESYGFVDSQVQWIRVNKATGVSEFYNQAGNLIIQLDASGNLNINVTGDFNLNVTGDINMKAGGNANIDGTLLQENMGASTTGAGVASTAESTADSLASSIDVPTGIGGFD
jgi:uncharacterized protein involved in type VI secretion and phage assembly